ncbi:HAD family hydrolase [Nakamurella deserti]|uniref:HAD family hydrolase n=1 Tax=Nakamurella deserti TaxID=2164074 RepID=UPI000DBE0F9A|nr:HAD family hydrolase [Nakamurella deserti]
MTVRAVLFDIDGTLVDSNYLHVQAWSEAMAAAGHPADDASIHRAIGMDSDLLLRSVLGRDTPTPVTDAAAAGHADRYQALASRLRVFDGARELLHAIHSGGRQVVLATSAPPAELDALLAVLDAADDVDHVTSGEDVSQAKPAAELIEVALGRAGVTAAEAVLVGDTVWDGEAAARAGVAFVGVLSGGIARAELAAAGAVAVYDDVATLLGDLDASPLRNDVSTPGSTRPGPRHG